MATVRTESIVSASSIARTFTKVIEIDGRGQYCGMIETVITDVVEAGTFHVSYRAEGGRVDFWLLNEGQFLDWSRIPGCADSRQMKGFASKLNSDSYDFTVDLQSGAYRFVFMNTNKNAVSITLSVDGGTIKSEVTVTRLSTSYSTQEIAVPTEIVSTNTRSAGFGLLFFSGIALIITGGIVLVVGRSRYRPQEAASSFQAASPTSQVPSVVTSVPLPTTAEKFCMNCGAALPVHVAFCNKCGSKQ
jgi:hypothetical protein